MNALRSRLDQKRRAFTLIEILVVVTIIGILITLMATVVNNSFRKAREAATTALIQKIEDLLDEHVKGFDRATKSRDFQRVVEFRKKALEASGVFGVSPKVIKAVARKDFYRQNFPQRWEDLAYYSNLGDGEDLNLNGVLDTGEDRNGNSALDGTNGVPDIIENLVSGLNLSVLQAQGLAEPGNPITGAALQRHITESSELLYFMVTHMQVFGPVGETEFGTSEVRDTDNDGLPEFIDGWERPLRFYRWPTRLLKPNGPMGGDSAWGTGGSSFLAFGGLGTDDVVVPNSQRAVAGLLIDGLPTGPVVAGQWDSLSEDPDDPYGLITTELKRLFVNFGASVLAGYGEPLYPTYDTYHTPLIVSVGADGVLGLYEPFDAGSTTMGVLAQPSYPGTAPYSTPPTIPSDVLSALTDNLTNRNRRAGRGK